MEGVPSQTILYHNKLSDIHDIDSYITFLKYAWVDHAWLMVSLLVMGCMLGISVVQYYPKIRNTFNKVVTYNHD